MPAYMTIGLKSEQKKHGWLTTVDTDEKFQGDVSGELHLGWIKIASFGICMTDAARADKWPEALSTGAKKARTTQDDERRRAEKERHKEEQKRFAEAKALQTAKGKQKPPVDGKTVDEAPAPAPPEPPKPRPNTLQLSKNVDISSAALVEWMKTPTLHDVQVDCCAMEHTWPFLTLVFIGTQITEYSIDDESSESLELTWSKAIIFSTTFDEHGEPTYVHIAEFGEEKPAVTTTTEDRGLTDYLPTVPGAQTGFGRGAGTTPMDSALSGALPPVGEESRTYDQDRRRLTIEKVGQLEFELDSFRGEESMSKLFVYDLELRAEEREIDPKDIVGHDVSFAIQDEEGREDSEREPRWISGVVSSFLVGEMASDRRRKYHAVVVPKVWKLTQRTDSRVFQDLNVKDIVEQVFNDAGFSDFDMQSVTRNHALIPYCVQYQETDFAFVSRLLEEAGIYYFFRHEEKKHTLVLCDGPAGYVRCPEDPLVFGWEVRDEPRVTSWRQHFAFVPGKFDARDFNFETPLEPVKAQAQTSIDLPGIKDVEIFEYPGEFMDAEQGTAVADRRLQEREVGFHLVHAVACYDSLVPGMTIAVEGLPGTEEGASSSSDRYLITSVRHQAEHLPEYGMSIVAYRTVLVCIPEKTPFMPARVTPKPVIRGPQTAIVVGDKESDEDVVDTDKYGRVKVQFHWDRKGKKDTNSSCWIRVLQPTAGAASGSMLIPRIGWEVVVGFLDGDPDRPIILGSLPNELHLPHHELPAAKYKSVLMTRSFPGGGKDNFNELTFHDEKDKEEVYFHAERDFKRVVEHNDVLEIGEKEDGGQTVTIEGDQSITINKGDRSLEVAKGTETIKVKGDRTVTIQSGNHTIDVKAGKCEISAAQSIELKVGGSSIKISASGIEIKVGGSSVKVDNTGVTSKGMMVKSEATVKADVKGMMVAISADAMLQTKGGITMMQ